MDAHSTPLLLLLALIHLLSHISARDSLLPGSPLSVEHSSDVLHSPDGTFTCGFYNISPNASTFSIWFSNSSEKTVVWSANLLHPVYTIISWKLNNKYAFRRFPHPMVVERKRSLGLAAARGEAEHRGLVSGGALACAPARGVLCLWEAERKRAAATTTTKWL